MTRLVPTLLLLLCYPAISWSQPSTESAADPAAQTDEVTRLTEMLRRYYANETAVSEGNSDATGVTGDATIDAGSLSAGKVRLSGSESLVAIQQMNKRLNNESITGTRRDLDVIYHIEVRSDGTLLSSKSYSLKSLGKLQYVGKVSLPGGQAEITVRDESWLAALEGAGSTDYIVTLSLSEPSGPELHLIPVAELQAAATTELPLWVPYLGAKTPTQS